MIYYFPQNLGGKCLKIYVEYFNDGNASKVEIAKLDDKAVDMPDTGKKNTKFCCTRSKV